MSAEGNVGAIKSDIDSMNDHDAFFVSSPAAIKHSSDDNGDIRQLGEEEIDKQIQRMSNEPVDVHNTGVSEQLKQLLSTLHEGESSPEISASGSAIGAQLGFSATAQEFVPGKLFTVPVERTQSTTGDQIAGLSLKADAPEFVPSWQAKPAVAGTTQQGGMLPVPSNGGSLTNVRVIDKKVWWYRDPAGVVRGPFSTTEMRAWADKGYFSVELEIALSDRGPYLPLSSVYPSPERAFWKTIEPREFATRMRQHILAARNVMISD